MQHTLDAFLSHLSAQGDTPAGTLMAYRTDLNQLIPFLADRGVNTVDLLCAEDLVAFTEWLYERGYASATIARRVVSLRALGVFLVQAGILPANPCADLRPPAVRRTLRPTLTPAQIEALRTLVLRNRTADGWRDHAILEVLTASALRVSDLMALNVEDISLDHATLLVHARSGKLRTVPLPAQAVMALATYLQLGRPKLQRANHAEPGLFLNQQGERLTRQGCWVVLKGYARQLGLDELSPEVLRQSVAAHRFANGATVDEVQALLGHATRKTTEVYQPAAPIAAF